MSHIQNTASNPTTVGGRIEPSRRLALATLLAAATLAALIAAATFAGRVPGAAPHAAGGAQRAVVDGWMAGTSAVSAALHGMSARPATDGWASRYLPSARDPRVTDGWARRYLPSANRPQVTDGWAGRYLH